jgi:ABC-type antimicrobial peptide transport system permease subunit
VSQRTREIAVRMAMGASRRDVVALVLREGGALAAAGIAAGLALAWAGGRALATLLYGVTPTDPLTYAAVVLGLGAVALAACWVPARRAAVVDPYTVLRG